MTANYNAPILPISFRVLNIGHRFSGNSMHNITIANSRKQLVHLFDPTLRIIENKEKHMFNNPYCTYDSITPEHISRILGANVKFPQLVIFDSGAFEAYVELDKTLSCIYKLLERSYNNSNYEYPINVIICVQYGLSVPKTIYKCCNVIYNAHEHGNDNRFAKRYSETGINIQDFQMLNKSLHNYQRVQINTVQKALTVHDPNTTHIPSKL